MVQHQKLATLFAPKNILLFFFVPNILTRANLVEEQEKIFLVGINREK